MSAATVVRSPDLPLYWKLHAALTREQNRKEVPGSPDPCSKSRSVKKKGGAHGLTPSQSQEVKKGGVDLGARCKSHKSAGTSIVISEKLTWQHLLPSKSVEGCFPLETRMRISAGNSPAISVAEVR